MASGAVVLDLLVRGGLLWDGTGAPVRPAEVLVHEGVIVAVGDHLEAPDGARVIDAAGATILPGLVDSHVHISMDPGVAFRPETPAQHAALLDHHLAAYLACGVTTILDPAITPTELDLVRGHLAAGAVGPQFLTLGTPLSPAGGYVAVVIPAFPSVATVQDVEAALDRVVEQGAVGVKTTVEPGFGAPIWPLYAPELRAAIKAGAAARGLVVYSHAMSPAHQRVAIEDLGARVLVHPLSRPDKAAVALAAAHHVYEVSTLAILDSFRTGWEPALLDDPLIQAVVPAVEIATARDPANVRGFQRQFAETNFPTFPPAALVEGFVFRDSTIRARVGREGAALRALAAAGVPIVMGSDSGNWPVILSEFHGPTSIHELELLAAAGFSNAEVLTAATRTPAEMLGRGAEQGTVEVGKRADLVIVDGDPLVDLGAMRHVRYTVRLGDARTPQEWLDALTSTRSNDRSPPQP